MYINKIDNLIDGIINNFYKFTNEKKIFEKFLKDDNFVKFQNEILNYIKEFTLKINKKEIKEIVKNDKYIDIIINIVKRYCAFYIYLGISYNYTAGRDLFVTNMIETSKNQKDATFKIENFYNSENNSKIINMYMLIKNILELQKFKTMDRIKIILNNNPIKYEKTIELFNKLGEEFVNEYFLIKDNFHNIIKTFIFKNIFILEEKEEIINILNEKEEENAEYKYIEVVVSNIRKLIDFNFFQSFLTTTEIKKGVAEDFYDFLEENKREDEDIVTTNMIIDFLFSNNILIPITEEFLRYHKNTEKYDKKLDDTIKDRDATKIKYITSKINRIKNLHSKVYNKNQKLKLEAMDLFYKPLKNIEATLYNDNEEVKIIKKLENSEQTTDLDYLVDLENIKNYAYVNYKDLSKDGFILRSSKLVQSIRYSSIKNKNKQLDLRVGHSNLPLHVIGLILNPSKKPLECFTFKNLRNIKEKEKNGYKSFLNILDKTFNDNSNKNLYYWMFNNDEDIIELKEYKNVSIFDKGKYIKNMLSEIYQYYINLIKNEIIVKLNKKKQLNIWETKNYISLITKQFVNFNNIKLNLNKEIINEIIDKVLKEYKYLQKDTYIDEKDIIKIPISDKIKKSIKVLVLTDKKEKEIILDEYVTKPVCNHYIKWINIKKIPRKNDDEMNQAIFNFVKQYVKVNENNDYICKSCGELLDLKKYVYEGTYVEELDTFLTTNLATNKNLYEIPKYSKYTRTIRNIEKNIEKMCYSANLNYYLGNTPVIKLRRKMIIKDVIDLLLIHTEYLKEQPKDRITKAAENYNINKDLTNLFFFELKDDIFLTSSTDTDYYKIIKFNNVIAYIMLLLLIDLNTGMILGFKDDKRCNYFLYDKVGKNMFENLFIRLNEKEKINISKIPLLGYVLFYFSCILTNNYIWLWNSNEKSGQYNIQKIIITTSIDLINTLIEANIKKNKNFLYELIVNRFIHKLKTVFNDENLLNIIIETTNSKIRIDKNTNKVGYIIKKNKKIDLDINNIYNKDFISNVNIKDICKAKIYKLEKLDYNPPNNNLNILTNCEEGELHSWNLKMNDLVCIKCNKKYSDLLEKFNKSKENINENNNKNIEKLKLINLRKLADTYCLSGTIHDIDPNNGKCIKCNINVDQHTYSTNDLLKLNDNLNKENNRIIYEKILKSKEKIEKENKILEKNKKIINKLNNRYIKTTDNKLTNYIDDFIEKLIKILGNKIKVNNNEIYLNNTLYIIKNDYLGNIIKKAIIIKSSDNKIKFENNHIFFNTNVLYYNDKLNGVFVYYDALTLFYLGYSKDKKKFVTYKSNSYIEKIDSLKDMILTLGLSNRYQNIDHIDDDIEKDKEKIIKKFLRIRINNLKQIINNSLSLIQKIHNNSKVISNEYNPQTNTLLKEFSKILKKFNIKNNEGRKKIFKNIGIINNKLTLEKIPKDIKIDMYRTYIDGFIFNKLNNVDNKLIYYYLYNLEKLLDYNSEQSIKINLCYFIIKIIIYSYNLYYTPIENIMIRRFEFLIEHETPYIDESLRTVGLYQELVNIDEIDDAKITEMEMDMLEESTALDIDDYEEDDMYEDFDVPDERMDNIYD
jgi:hypothetical protein